MIDQQLMETARLLVAAVQDSEDFSADYLRKLIIKIVPMLLGEIEILAYIAAHKFADAADLSSVEVTLTEARPKPQRAKKEKVKKPKGKGRKR